MPALLSVQTTNGVSRINDLIRGCSNQRKWFCSSSCQSQRMAYGGTDCLYNQRSALDKLLQTCTWWCADSVQAVATSLTEDEGCCVINSKLNVATGGAIRVVR